MTEIKIQVEEQYLQALLNFLQTLPYVQLKLGKMPFSANRIDGLESSNVEEAGVPYLNTLPSSHPLRAAIKPIRRSAKIEDLIKESGYIKTDWEKIRQLAQDLDIQESAEDLIAQLNQ